MQHHPQRALGILESSGFSPAIVALDAMKKAADISVLQAELNDFLGTVIKIQGSPANVETAISVGQKIAERMSGKPVATTINRVAKEAWQAIESPAEFNPLIQQDVVHLPQPPSNTSSDEELQETNMSAAPDFAIGLLETQGFTAVFEAIDTACKAANVEVIGKEKLGGGYVTIIIKGDVAAVNAAIEAGKSKVDALGTLIAAHVIPRPSGSVLSLLPQ